MNVVMNLNSWDLWPLGLNQGPTEQLILKNQQATLRQFSWLENEINNMIAFHSLHEDSAHEGRWLLSVPSNATVSDHYGKRSHGASPSQKKSQKATKKRGHFRTNWPKLLPSRHMQNILLHASKCLVPFSWLWQNTWGIRLWEERFLGTMLSEPSVHSEFLLLLSGLWFGKIC